MGGVKGNGAKAIRAHRRNLCKVTSAAPAITTAAAAPAKSAARRACEPRAAIAAATDAMAGYAHASPRTKLRGSDSTHGASRNPTTPQAAVIRPDGK